ncbi:MAG: response regulator [Armatimonadetes bacterium]|nr:response regulator [Anaerolineae bacterium]
MSLVPMRLLIINRQLDFAVTVKTSLEQIGGYEVAAFTSADTALEYLRNRPHDLVLVDFAIRGIPGVEIVAKVRSLQPDIAVIATPKNAETVSAMRDYALQDVIDTPMPVRQLMPVLQRAVKLARETLLPDTAEAPSIGDSQTLKLNPPEIRILEGLLDSTGDGMETLEVDMSDVAPPKPVISAFDLLAAEEPPMPGAEENATVRDLRDSLLSSSEQMVVALLSVNQALTDAQPLPPDDGDQPDEPILARQILEGTLDHTSSLKALVEQVAPESSAAAAAVEAFDAPAAVTPVDEAADAVDSAPGLGLTDANAAQIALELTQASLEFSADATLLSRGTEVLAYAGTLPQADLALLQSRMIGAWGDDEPQSRIRFVNLPNSGKDYMLYARRTEDDLTLTMIFAGNLPLRVIRRQSDKLLAALSAVPEAGRASAPDAVVPFDTVNQAQSDDDTDADDAADPDMVVLSESGLEAAVVAGVEQPPAVVYSGSLVPYTYIWLLRDGTRGIPDGVAQAIVAGLDLYLTERGWGIQTLRVHEDYIYLCAAVPADRAAQDIVMELKAHSAHIAATKTPGIDAAELWADAYLALFPGREMDTEEVQRFIRFGRDAS